jgi:hypothetical protein
VKISKFENLKMENQINVQICKCANEYSLKREKLNGRRM